MTTDQNAAWHQAKKAPFEAFGILYYPLFARRADLEGVALDDADMAWAVTANANLDGTGYTLSQPSILALAAYRHHMAALAANTGFLPLAKATGEFGLNPLADLRRLVPDVTATPMYPDFPTQVMEMDEATFRYHQQMHYLSTYGVELVAGMMGLDVTVSQGWMPDVDSTPKTEDDETLIAPKVLHLILTVEDLRSVVSARLARATRMHPAEIESTLLVFEDLGEEADEVSFPKVAFHENMMELIRVAADADSATLTRVAGGLAQHPGDLLKATLYVLDARKKSRQAIGKKGYLATRQKKGLCRAFERFSVMSIAHNIADAGKKERRAPNYLSIERFAGPNLTRACELVWSGEVISWSAELERLWAAVEEAKAPAPTPEPEQLRTAVAQAETPAPTPEPEPEPVDVALSSHKTPLPDRLRSMFDKLVHRNGAKKAAHSEKPEQPARPTPPAGLDQPERPAPPAGLDHPASPTPDHPAAPTPDQPTPPADPAKLEAAWQALLAHYGKRPGMLFRSLARLAKHGCPEEPLQSVVMEHADSYSLPTIVRTLTIMSEEDPGYRLMTKSRFSWYIDQVGRGETSEAIVSLLRNLLAARLATLDTPLKGKRVHLDTQGISLAGSILMPNDTGDTGTAWPPVGIAYELPDNRTVRFFTFWDERRYRVDVDLHFIGIKANGEDVRVGWNAHNMLAGMVTSGDVTTSNNSVEYLDANMKRAREEGVHLVVQLQHIYSGASSWDNIETCYAGAMVVSKKHKEVKLYNARNLLFRDDLTGNGKRTAYAVVNFTNRYVRIMRGANLPLGDVEFSLGDYLASLLEAQEAMLVATPEEADIRVCVGRSDDPTVVSLFDEGFFLA